MICRQRLVCVQHRLHLLRIKEVVKIKSRRIECFEQIVVFRSDHVSVRILNLCCDHRKIHFLSRIGFHVRCLQRSQPIKLLRRVSDRTCRFHSIRNLRSGTDCSIDRRSLIVRRYHVIVKLCFLRHCQISHAVDHTRFRLCLCFVGNLFCFRNTLDILPRPLFRNARTDQCFVCFCLRLGK